MRCHRCDTSSAALLCIGPRQAAGVMASQRGKAKECNKLAAHAKGRPAGRNIRAARPTTPDDPHHSQHRQRARNKTGSAALPTNTNTRRCYALCMQVPARANQKVQHAKESTSQGHLPGRHRPATQEALIATTPHIHTCSAVPEAPLGIFCGRLHRRPATTQHTRTQQRPQCTACCTSVVSTPHSPKTHVNCGTASTTL